ETSVCTRHSNRSTSCASRSGRSLCLTRPISASISTGSVELSGSLSVGLRFGMGRRFYGRRPCSQSSKHIHALNSRARAEGIQTRRSAKRAHIRFVRGTLLLCLPPLRQIFLGQRGSGRLSLHQDARNLPAAGFFDRLNAVDAARDLLAIALQRVAAP